MRLHGEIGIDHVESVLVQFEDEIYQRPPLRSSVKRQLRTRRIYYLNFLEMDRRNVLFKVGCEGGTYIRKLCFDIGEVLGCGAHMQELRRTRAGPFVEADSVTLHEVAYAFMQWEEEKKNEDSLRKFIKPMEAALGLLPKIVIRDSAVDAVCHGASLAAPGVLSVETGLFKNSLAAVFTLKNEAVALVKAACSADELVKMDHGIVANIERVLMQRGTYPKCWKSGEI